MIEFHLLGLNLLLDRSNILCVTRGVGSGELLLKCRELCYQGLISRILGAGDVLLRDGGGTHRLVGVA